MTWNRIFRNWAIVFATCYVAAAFLNTSPACGDDELTDDARLRNLLIERRDTMREAVAIYRKTFTGDHFRYQGLLPWINRLEEAELAACQSADEQIAAHKALQDTAFVDFLDVKHRFETGVPGGSALDYAAAKLHWLNSQIGLHQMLNEMEAKPKLAQLFPWTVGNELVSALQKHRLEVLHTHHRAAQAEYTVGTVTIFDMALAERELFNATFAAYKDHQKRMAVFDKHIERLRRNEREQNHPHGRTLYLKYFQALRAEAQIERMREFAKPETSAESQETYHELASERDSAIEWLLTGALAKFQVGTLSVEEPFNIQNIARDVALADAKTPAERIRVFENHLAACKRLEREVATRTGDRGKMRSFLFSKSERLTAEIDLLRERMRDQRKMSP